MADTATNTGQFAKVVVTNAGKEMITKSQNGQTLTFTRVALGDGMLEENEDILALTAVKNERLSANIAKYSDKENGQFELQFRISNQEVETGFWHREIGIMAKIDEGEEQLYAYTTAGNKASFLYDKTTPIEERIVNLAFIIGNAQNVQVIVNFSIIYVTLKDMEETLDTHNTSTDSHTEAFEKHNTDENAHKELLKKYLLLTGGTTSGLIQLATDLITNLATNIPPTDNSGKLAPTAWVNKTIQNYVGQLSEQVEVITDEETGYFTCPALGISGLMAQNGYISLGKLFGRLMIQWGILETGIQVNLPISFKKQIFAILPFSLSNISTETAHAAMYKTGYTLNSLNIYHAQYAYPLRE